MFTQPGAATVSVEVFTHDDARIPTTVFIPDTALTEAESQAILTHLRADLSLSGFTGSITVHRASVSALTPTP